MLSNSDRARVDAYRLLMANVYELAAVSRRSSEALARRRGMTVTQWHTLSVLSGGRAATVPVVAARLGVTRQAVQRVADQLVDSGHLERTANPHHHTSPLLRPTAAGEQVLQELWETSDAPRAAMLTGLDAARLDEATATLHALVVALNGSDEHRAGRVPSGTAQPNRPET